MKISLNSLDPTLQRHICLLQDTHHKGIRRRKVTLLNKVMYHNRDILHRDTLLHNRDMHRSKAILLLKDIHRNRDTILGQK